jgi:hypothetical protein
MFKVVLLVCAANITPAECHADTAIHLVNGPDATNEVMCGMQSQAYLAQTWIGRSLADGEYVKIVCRRDAGGPVLKAASARR